MSLRWSLTYTLFGLVLSYPVIASAQVEVAIVRLALEDDILEESSREIEEALVAGLRPTASRVFFIDEVRGALAIQDDSNPCDPDVCELRAAQTLGAQAAIQGRFSQLGQLYEVEAELFLTRDGSRLGGTSLSCQACTFTEALETVRRAGQGLQPSLPGLVTITVDPATATVTIDGEPTGEVSPFALAPGTHRIGTSAEGYREQSREITVVSGGSSEVVLSLSAASTGTDPPQPRESSGLARSPQLWGWVSFGAAIGALVPGVLWLALEGRCAIGSESWNDICVDVYYTWPQGLAVTLVGVGFLSAAVALLVIHRRNQRRSSGVRPTMMAGAGSIFVGAEGFF